MARYERGSCRIFQLDAGAFGQYQDFVSMDDVTQLQTTHPSRWIASVNDARQGGDGSDDSGGGLRHGVDLGRSLLHLVTVLWRQDKDLPRLGPPSF